MRAVRLLSLRRLRLNPLRAVLAALVVGAGTSLVVSILVISASLTESMQEAGRALAGPAPLRVLGPLQRGGITPETVAEIEDVDGVAAVVPLVQSIALVDPATGADDEPVMLLAFDCRVQAILGDLAGGAPCTDELLASLRVPFVGTPLAADIGPGATLRANAGRLALDDAIAVPGLDELNDGRVVALPEGLARRHLTDRDGRFDVVYVLVDDGASPASAADAIGRVLPPDHRVLDAADPPPLIGVVLATFLPLFSAIAILTLGIGGVLVRNSITLSLEERRRQTAIVSALGGSGRLLVGGTVAEAAVLGAVGGLLGVGGGTVLAHPISGGIDRVTRQLAGVSLEITTPPSAIVVGVLVGLLVAVGVSIGPARRAGRLDVAGELSNRGRREEAAAGRSPLRILIGVGVMALGLGLAAWAQTGGGLEPIQALLAPGGVFIVTLGGVYVVAASVPLLLGVVEGRRWIRRAPLRLAVSNLRREPKRTGVMAVALGFAMGVGFLTASFHDSISQAITEQANENLDGIQVSALDPQNSVGNETRLSPAVLRELEDLPGVDRLDLGSFVVAGNEPTELIGVSGYTDVWLSNPMAAGRARQADLDAGKVIIGPGLARDEGLRPGDRLSLPSPAGPVSLEVSGVMFNGDFGGRNVLMTHDLITELYGAQAPISVNVVPADGVSEVELLATVRAADLDPGIEVESRQEVIDRNIDSIAEQLSMFDAIQRGLLVMSFIAVLSTLLLVGIQRHREFGMLAAVGMTPSELRRMVLWEAGIVAALGVLVTCAAAFVQLAALYLIIPVIIGFRDPWVVDLGAMVIYGLIAVATAVVAGIIPSRRAGRVEVLDALRYE
ncbi:MAG: FtsX-like permease family protein [Actinomycetota bacterium]|nr:FtsX-like permease family protein [Actinomycetota bacterium]